MVFKTVTWPEFGRKSKDGKYRIISTPKQLQNISESCTLDVSVALFGPTANRNTYTKKAYLFYISFHVSLESHFEHCSLCYLRLGSADTDIIC